MFGSQSSSFVRLRLADPNRLSNFPIARFQFLLKQAEAEYAKLYYLSQLHNLPDRLVFEGVAIGSRVVTLYLQHLGYKSFFRSSFDFDDKIQGLSDIRLNSGIGNVDAALQHACGET